MNCKPGDLAVVVRGVENVGRIVTVMSASNSRWHGPGWWYVEVHGQPAPGTYTGTNKSGFGNFGHIEDCRLRPIRDPGEDAECESKAWLPPVPNSTKETV